MRSNVLESSLHIINTWILQIRMNELGYLQKDLQWSSRNANRQCWSRQTSCQDLPISKVFILKSIPMVDINDGLKVLSAKRNIIHVFPTPLSPISRSLKNKSNFFAITRLQLWGEWIYPWRNERQGAGSHRTSQGIVSSTLNDGNSFGCKFYRIGKGNQTYCCPNWSNICGLCDEGNE